MKRRIKAILVIIFITYSSLSYSNDEPRNGNYWREMDYSSRLDYVVGFFDGIHLGYEFSYWGLNSENGPDCNVEVYNSFSRYCGFFLKNVTNDQIVDGLNEFYQDYRNRSIRVPDAIWIVLNMIAGVDNSALEEMIKNFRRNAKM